MTIDNKSSYPLRRNRTRIPHQSPLTRRKLKEVLHTDNDDVFVATYNHHNGGAFFDKEFENEDAEIFEYEEKEERDGNTSTLRKFGWLQQWVQKVLRHNLPYLLHFMIVCVFLYLLYKGICCGCFQEVFNAVSLLKVVEQNNNSQFQMSDRDSQEWERILEELSVQRQHIEELNAKINLLEQQSKKENCSCHEKMTRILNEQTEQKTSMEAVQHQLLMTVQAVKSVNERVGVVQKFIEDQNTNGKNTAQKSENEGELCKGKDCQGSDTLTTIHAYLETYQADGIGMTDFALESAGGSIHSPHHSATCDVGTPIIKVFGMPLWQDPRSPRAVISPENFPGKCWPMKGSQGFIVVKLATAIDPSMVTLEHLDKRLDQYSKDSYAAAPKDFEIYAWLHATGKVKINMGMFTYNREEAAIQTFKLKKKVSQPISFMELRILTNYGNEDCTCIYRFRVHGASYAWIQQYQEKDDGD